MGRRERMARVAEGLEELARGNFAHRVILPGDDEASRMAEHVNRLADAVQRDHEAAAASDAAQRQLLANISHDLRTPITSIAGYVDALQRGLGDEPERYLAVLAQKTAELAQLTDDLFYAARIDAGDLELTPQQVDLAEAVRRSLLGFEPQLSARGVRVELGLPEEPRFVDADPTALGRILSNLLGNALQHGETMTWLRLELLEMRGEAGGSLSADRAYTVRIRNNGTTLPIEPERLFERGVAGDGGGTGLGLSIARELVERMGGRIAAANDGAATFSLTFPASA